jgi:predicted MPP superfamily phosphohydrolase
MPRQTSNPGSKSRWIRRVALLGVTLAALIGAVLLADVAFWREPRSVTIGLVEVRTPAWPADTAPLRIALLSDFHVDNVHMSAARIQRLARTTAALDPDVVVLGGDYVGGLLGESGRGGARGRRTAAGNRVVEDGLRALGAFKARHGVFAVIGNHDCWWDCERAATLLAEGGVTVLENANLRVRRPGGDFWIVGLEDAQTQKPDFQKATAGLPAGVATIGVAHNPGLFDWESNGLPVLLAGHTHGGQVRFPWIGAPAKMSRHTDDAFQGFFVRDGRVLVVTRGLGETGLPVRFGSPPEILMVEISHGATATASRSP